MVVSVERYLFCVACGGKRFVETLPLRLLDLPRDGAIPSYIRGGLTAKNFIFTM